MRMWCRSRVVSRCDRLVPVIVATAFVVTGLVARFDLRRYVVVQSPGPVLWPGLSRVSVARFKPQRALSLTRISISDPGLTSAYW